MNLLNPHALWLFALLPLVWLVSWSGRRFHARKRLLFATVLRSLVLLLAVLALAQPVVPERSRAISIVYAIDVSRSVSSAFVNQALDWAEAANERFRPDRTRYLVFGDGYQMLDSVEEVRAVAVSDSVSDRERAAGIVGQSATDIESAMHAAMFGFAPNHARRLVMISDGNETRGNAERTLPSLRKEGVRVFPVPAVTVADVDAWVESIDFPPDVRQQEPVRIRVTVRASAQMKAKLKILVRERVLSRQEVELTPGENIVGFDLRLPRQGSESVTAAIESEADQIARNNVLTATVQVGPRPHVLYVEGTPASAHYLADALKAHFIDVTVTTAAGLDQAPERVNGYDAVMLSDVYAHDFGPRTIGVLDRFVREKGGGLVFAAGESTYGKQGYAGHDIERLLPVRFEARRKREELDLVLLIDRSHSMRGRKLELAKTAALSTLDLLEEQHRLAVIGFDSKPHEVVPLREVGTKRRAEDLIASMTASGQTDMYPALAMAKRILATSTSSTKHVILLSDGVSSQRSFGQGRAEAERIHARIQEGRAEEIRRAGGVVPDSNAPRLSIETGSMEDLVVQMAAENISLSTIAIGPKPNLDLMNAIAEIAGGKSYVAKNDAEMPGLFVSETRRLLGDSIIEEDFRPSVASRTNAIAGVDFRKGPPLKGFVTTRAKQFADVLLKAPQDQPLLVTTYFGLGRTSAFLSDVKNRWSAEWLTWDGYGRFWSQAVRDVIARHARAGVSWTVVRQGEEAVIALTALTSDFAYLNNLLPRVRVSTPEGDSYVLALRQTAPGEYGERVPLLAHGSRPYRFELVEGGGVTAAQARGAGENQLAYTWTDEYRALPPNNALLKAFGEQTGGMFAPRAEDVFADYGDVVVAPRMLWPHLVAAALLLFLFDLLIRRAPGLPRFLLRESRNRSVNSG